MAASPVALTARVDEREALRYLGMVGTDRHPVPPAMRQAIDRMVAWAVCHLRPIGVHATYPVLVKGDCIEFAGAATELSLQSRDLASLLHGCELATIVAVTLGSELDDQVALLADQGRVADAAILDAVASDCVEQAVDELCLELAFAAAGSGFAVSERFSPGYGDLSLATQPAIVAGAGGATIDISVLPSLMMVPLKSVTAVFGWRRTSDGDQAVRIAPDCQGGCSCCALEQCRFRRSDTHEGSRAR